CFPGGKAMDYRSDAAVQELPYVKLSYKFQRLREQIREAILRGELTEQLPGERELGRRFRANAKTINKALSDLAGEGLVSRLIGRGTFVNAAPHSAIRFSTTKTVHWIEASSPGRRPNWKTLVDSALSESGHRLMPVTGIHTQGGVSVDPGFFKRADQLDA